MERRRWERERRGAVEGVRVEGPVPSSMMDNIEFE
jgi:hypothetical protein